MKRRASSSEVVLPYRPHGSILNQILRPIQRFPERLKSVRIIAFAFWFDGGVPKAADRGAQASDRLVSNPEGFRQSLFQNFALGIECLSGPGTESRRFRPRKERSEFPARRSKPATGFALTLPIRRAGLESPLEYRHGQRVFIRTL
jgi:hypothetical protein